MAEIQPIVVPPPLSSLSAAVAARPESFATGDDEIRTVALAATKFVFDNAVRWERASLPHVAHFIATLNPSDSTPQTRSGAQNKGKRKKAPASPPPDPLVELSKRLKPTPLDELFVEGMDDEQIWSQMEIRTAVMCELVETVFEGEFDDPAEQENVSILPKSQTDPLEDDESMELDEDDEDEEYNEDSDEAEMFGDENSMESEEDAFGDDGDEDEEDEEDLGEGVAALRDRSEEEEDEDEDEIDLDRPSSARSASRRSGPSHPILDDGFFSLATFNAETEAAEAKSTSRGRLGDDSDDDDETESIDFFEPLDEETNALEEDGTDEGGDVMFYKDFFAPPPRGLPKKAIPDRPRAVRFNQEVKVKNIKPNNRKSMSLSRLADLHGVDLDEDDEENENGLLDGLEDEDDENEESEEDEVDDEDVDEGELDRETIERFKDDLFAEDDEKSDNDLSKHQTRLLELNKQIQQLEAENIGPKDWTLIGEASSRSRPVNSLLEEDLEFDRVARAVPVVTEERVASLEDLIKTRILESRFDDVVRKRPVDDKPFLPSRLFELQDTKSTQSLAQIYEDEYTAAQSGTIAGDDRDGKLKKEHEELEKIWEGICYKLDSLSNAHFTPKAPKATISTISNVPTASLESALPTMKSTTTLLAPEEIFAAKSSDNRARSELTPGEKRALRGKERKKRKKMRDQLELNVDKFAKTNGVKKGSRGKSNVREEKEKALRGIVKHGRGVTVVGKKSETKKGTETRVEGKSLKL